VIDEFYLFPIPISPVSCLTPDFDFLSSVLMPPPEINPTETCPFEKLEKLPSSLSSSIADDALLRLLWIGCSIYSSSLDSSFDEVSLSP